MNLRKIERYFRVNLLGMGPRLMKKEFYRAAVSQSLGNWCRRCGGFGGRPDRVEINSNCVGLLLPRAEKTLTANRASIIAWQTTHTHTHTHTLIYSCDRCSFTACPPLLTWTAAKGDFKRLRSSRGLRRSFLNVSSLLFLQGDSGEKVNNLGGDSIGNFQ